MSEIEFVQVTWMRAFKVWWSLLWRTLLFSFLTATSASFILGFIMGLAKAEAETIKAACIIAGYFILIPVGIVVTKTVLKRHYSDFKIALITKMNQE